MSERINTFKNYKEFKSNLGKFLKEKDINSNGGGAGPHIDTYGYSYSSDFSKPYLVIDMDREYRERLGRKCDYSLKPRYRDNDDKVTVYNLKDNEFWEVAFDALSDKLQSSLRLGQTTLFDFL